MFTQRYPALSPPRSRGVPKGPASTWPTSQSGLGRSWPPYRFRTLGWWPSARLAARRIPTVSGSAGSAGRRSPLPPRPARRGSSSRSSSRTSRTRHGSGTRSTPRSCERCSPATSRRCGAFSTRTGAQSRSTSGTRSWRSSGCPRSTRTTRCGRSAPQSRWRLRSQRSTRSSNGAGACGSTHRTGVNTGEVVAGDSGTGQRLATGDVVNVAARLEQAAPPLGILIGESTYRFVREAVEVEPLGVLALKGRPEPVLAYRLLDLREGDGGPRGDSRPLIGRERELASLSDALEQAVTEDACRLVTVIAEAGIGKSRLHAAFAESVQGRTRSARGRCLPYGRGITFWPLLEVVRQVAGIGEEDAPEVARSKLGACLAGGGRRIRARRFGGRALRARSSPSRRSSGARASSSSRSRASGRSSSSSRMCTGAKTTFLDLVERVAESLQAPVLLVCAARPDFDQHRPSWGTDANAVRLALEPLSDEQSAELVESALGSAGGRRPAAHRAGRRGESALRRAAPLDARRRRPRAS